MLLLKYCEIFYLYLVLIDFTFLKIAISAKVRNIFWELFCQISAFIVKPNKTFSALHGIIKTWFFTKKTAP